MIGPAAMHQEGLSISRAANISDHPEIVTDVANLIGCAGVISVRLVVGVIILWSMLACDEDTSLDC